MAAYRIKPDTIIQLELAPWAQRELKLSTPRIRGTFVQIAKYVGGLIKRGEQPMWPFASRDVNGEPKSDYRIKVNGVEHKLYFRVITPDEQTLYLPAALEIYFREHFAAK